MSDDAPIDVLDVLIVEDGDEYLANLSTFVARGIVYRQARDGASATRMIAEQRPDLVYLDMRFDRIPFASLEGSVVELAARFNGDTARARRFQQDNQGLFILRALRDHGYSGPVILSYDFSAEERRFRALRERDPALHYCPDFATSDVIEAAIRRAVRSEPVEAGGGD